MIRIVTTLSFSIAVLAAIGLYKVKIEARELAKDVRQIERDIAKTEEAISMLQAEWSVLNDPVRIQRLAEDHLGLKPMSSDQIMIVTSFEGDGRRQPLVDRQPQTLEDLLAQ
ncbi:MAG: cell division protein FtsL [Pseudomonadota bacterium]